MAPIRACASIAVLAWSTRMARRGVPSWDAATFRRLNALPDALAPIAWLPMQAGALAMPLVSGTAIAMRGDRRMGFRVAATGAGAWAAAKVLKRFVARGRPGDHDPATVLRLGSADHGLGYPSGHAAVAATIAAAVPTGATRGRRFGITGLATVVGMSRIYVGAHYPLDVIGGWALGALIGEAFRAAEGVILSDPGS